MQQKNFGLLNTADQSDLEANKEYAYYGRFQGPFAVAFVSGREKEDEPGRRENMYAEFQGAGYYITETTLGDVGIDPRTSPLDPNAWFDKMNEEAGRQATLKFRENPELRNKDIEDFMYPIHFIKKTERPQKLYTFWRMPLPGGPELELKRLGKWPDYYNPNGLKERPPFQADPAKGFTENLKDALTKSIDPAAREVVGDVAKWVQQIPRLAFGTLEFVGRTTSGLVGIFSDKSGKKVAETLGPITEREPGTLQGIDELSTGASDPKLAMSDFYKDRTNNYENARTYRALLEYARDRRQNLYLEVMQDKAFQRAGNLKLSYSSDWYTTEMPADFKYDDFARWYEGWKEKSGNGPLPKLEKALKPRTKVK
jgi:hypothetical protein